MWMKSVLRRHSSPVHGTFQDSLGVNLYHFCLFHPPNGGEVIEREREAGRQHPPGLVAPCCPQVCGENLKSDASGLTMFQRSWRLTQKFANTVRGSLCVRFASCTREGYAV